MTSRDRKASLLASIGLASGLVAQASAQGPQDRAKPWPIANLVYDFSTGEFTARDFNWRPSAAPLWINHNADPCLTGGTVGYIDDPDLDGDMIGDVTGRIVDGSFDDVPFEESIYTWWGDIEPDTVVSQIVIAYAIQAPDADEDEDGIGDGIPGYDLLVRFADADNGFGTGQFVSCRPQDRSARCCILTLEVSDIPGAPPGVPEGYVATYLLTLDLTTAPALVFEIADADGEDGSGVGNSGSAIYGFPTGYDSDGDGLMDFGYSLYFDQGDATRRGANGFLGASPKLGAPGDRPVTPADAQGAEDAYDTTDPNHRYSYGTGECDPGPQDLGQWIHTWWFGGYNLCEMGDPVLSASGFLELYGESVGCLDAACSPADLAPPCGVIDFSDVLAFLTHYGSFVPAADLAPPYGTYDFTDVLTFLTAFGAGCP